MKKYILTFLLLFPNLLFAGTFDDFASRIESWVKGLQGYVLSSGNDIIIDLGKNDNVVVGMEFTTSKEGEELFHPVTEKSIGRKQIETGKIIVTRVYERYSTCKALKDNGIKAKDIISHQAPVSVKFNINLLEDSEVAKLKYALFKYDVLKEDEKALYVIDCSRKKRGDNTATCNLKLKDEVILSESISVKGVKIISTSENKSVPYKIDTKSYSLSLGYFRGKDDNPLVAISNRSDLKIYEIRDNFLFEVFSIDKIKEKIVNIEAIDINNNGKDEIFISAVTKKNEPSSYIYEYDNGQFKVLQKNIPYFFRTYFVNNQKHIVCQSYTEGAMTGVIYGIAYDKDNKTYSFNIPYDRSYGAAIYGFGMINWGKNQDEILFFNRHGQISLTENDNIKTYQDHEFSNTPNYLEYSEKLSTGVNVGTGNDSSGYFVYDEQSIIVPVYQRIIQLEDGSIILYANKLEKPNIIGKYQGGRLGSYYLTNTLTPLWEEIIDGTAVADIDITTDGKYLGYIISTHKNGLAKSFLYMINNDI